ncbi:aldo/keto reductase [Christensenellaceae bacterium]|nr:aldo/keto reductase [Christensenellaceae bacterium]BDF62096.1 aldo/keto reductase [Christensenellaceae bacterium]
MQYRKFGRLDFEGSALGFGCMRLPTPDGNVLNPDITEKEAVGIIRYAIDNGVNYVDTAYLYHSGESERMVGRALADGYRRQVKLATKAPMQLIHSAADYDAILNEQLTKLNTECIDLYMFHGIGRKTWDVILKEDLLSRAEAAARDGKIRYIGFSFHDTYEAFEEIVNGYDKWDFCQIQYNFMDTQSQAGTKGLKLAAEKGLGVVVMEPLRGGKLANPLKEVRELMERRGYTGTLSDLALRWVWAQSEVSVVLSGMSGREQVRQNLCSAQRAGAPLTRQETELIDEIREIYKKREGIPCTGCSYCMPCPQGIDIPWIMDIYNDGVVYDYLSEPRRRYNFFGRPASKCIQCKKCEEKCPQGLPIAQWLREIDGKLSL